MALDAAGIALNVVLGAAALLSGAALLVHLALWPGSTRKVAPIPVPIGPWLAPAATISTPGVRNRAILAMSGLIVGSISIPFAGLPAAPLAAVLAVMGWLAPRLIEERRREGERAAALSQVQLAIALLRAQIAMGVGLESALRAVAMSPLSGPALAKRMRSVLAAYGLGRPIEPALADMGRELGSAEIEILARSISQARRLGVGLEETLARAEFEFAAAHERRVAAAAERAQVRSQLLIVGCYLPAFMAMVLIPLFLGMLQGLGG